jgi:hypothetical protein
MLATAEPGQERIASEKPSYRKLFFRGPGRLLRVRVVSAGSTPGAVHDAEVLAGAGASSRIARLVPQSEFAFACRHSGRSRSRIRCVHRVRLASAPICVRALRSPLV